jgi:hypothetical protein
MFDEESGFALTARAEKLVADSWNDDEEFARDFRVPFSKLSAATGNFSADMRIGGGGSCEVFKAVVYGVNVAIKSLKTARNDDNEGQHALETVQFQAEMKLLQKVRQV